VTNVGDIESSYFVRFHALDVAGVLSKISGVLGNYGVSIEYALQPGAENDGGRANIYLGTRKTKHSNIINSINEIKKLKTGDEPIILGEPRLFRILDQ
jgi:homoserine dehydrogenase